MPRNPMNPRYFNERMVKYHQADVGIYIPFTILAVLYNLYQSCISSVILNEFTTFRIRCSLVVPIRGDTPNFTSHDIDSHIGPKIN